MCTFLRPRGQQRNRNPEKSGLIPVFCFLCLLLSGCATMSNPPNQPKNICEIFRENPEWYEMARESSKRWNVPIPILMAIIHQESSFISDAKPPRTSCLWIFPGPRPSSAYGYAQASDETWEEYLAGTGNTWADRDDFGDAVDFVGWYCDLSYRRSQISKQDTYNLYLAYHEGHGGFNRKTYLKKKMVDPRGPQGPEAGGYLQASAGFLRRGIQENRKFLSLAVLISACIATLS